MFKQLILLESNKNNRILAVKYNLITPEVREKYNLVGHINFEENESLRDKKEFLLEPEPIIISKKLERRVKYLNEISNKKLRKKASKVAKKHNQNISIKNLSDDSLKRMILGYEEIKGKIYNGNFMPNPLNCFIPELIFSNAKDYVSVKIEGIEKIGSAELLLKTLFPRKYNFDGIFESNPMIYIKETEFTPAQLR